MTRGQVWSACYSRQTLPIIGRAWISAADRRKLLLLLVASTFTANALIPWDMCTACQTCLRFTFATLEIFSLSVVMLSNSTGHSQWPATLSCRVPIEFSLTHSAGNHRPLANREVGHELSTLVGRAIVYAET
jgi:hypothetical protein